MRLTEPGLDLVGVNGRGHAMGTAVAAIRPEDFTVGGPGPNQLEVLVEVVEYQGRDLSIEAVTSGGRKVHFRTGDRLAAGDKVVLGVNPERVLVFGET